MIGRAVKDEALVEISVAKTALAKARDLTEVLIIRDKAAAMVVYAQAQGAAQTANLAKEIQLRAERKAGKFLRETEKQHGARPSGLQGATPRTLEELGIEKTQSHRWQLEAKVPEEKFEKWIEETRENNGELSATALMRLAKGAGIQEHWTGDIEWYTPKYIIDAVREVMGDIDLDPASNDEAQKTIRAESYYTQKDNGLEQRWYGRVFLNPPFKQPLIQQFIDKLLDSIECEDVTQAILLTNNNTDTQWFHAAARLANNVRFTKGRIHFVKQDEVSQPTNGQAFFYFGPNVEKFRKRFARCFGIGMITDENIGDQLVDDYVVPTHLEG